MDIEKCAQSVILFLIKKHDLNISTTYIKKYVKKREEVFAEHFPHVSKDVAKRLVNTATMYEDMKVKDNNFWKEYMKEVKAFYEAMIALDDDEYKEIKRSSEDKKASTHTSLPSHRNLIPIRGVSWGGMVARTHIWIVETNISI